MSFIKQQLHVLFLGLEVEGVFRINGNSKVVERLRVAFDKGGGDSVELDDVMASASLLKLFLRELPEGVITQKTTGIMVAKHQGNGKCHAGTTIFNSYSASHDK